MRSKNASPRFLPAVGALLGGLLLFAAACSDAPRDTDDPLAGKVITASEYYCPPCGCDEDESTFQERGRCPACGMKLIEVGKYTNRYPIVSPDGATISFLSTRDGTSEIYAMDPDGANEKRLTHNDQGDDENVSWSPDGTRIAYTSYHVIPLDEASNAAEIYVMKADGSDRTRLTDNDAWDSQPAWSPDGAQIAFALTRDGNYEIYVMGADGSNPVNVTNHESRDMRPRWTADGAQIRFLSNRSGQMALYAMEADGSNVAPLMEEPGSVWSPDGTKVLVARGPGRDREIFVRRADGTEEVQLTDTPGFNNTAPVWSPDGTRIYFESDRDGQPEIYVMNADGSAQTRLTRQ
jgi:Tol biopolymer transport system component